MSLKTSHGPDNRVIETGLNVTYSRECVSGSWTGDTLVSSGDSQTYFYMWEYHRRASKRYRYVGMDESAKDACVADMKEEYTRDIKASFWTPTTGDGGGLGSWSDDDAGQILTACIVPVQNEDGSWDVEISVNEDDVRMRKTYSKVSPSSLFTTERSRSYDGETENTTVDAQ